jgi:predicted Ser/Thr protein kinase
MEVIQACFELEKFGVSAIELSHYTNKMLVKYGVLYLFMSIATTLLIIITQT